MGGEDSSSASATQTQDPPSVQTDTILDASPEGLPELAPSGTTSGPEDAQQDVVDMNLVGGADQSVDFLGTGDLNGMDHVMGDIVDMNGGEEMQGWTEGDNHELKRVKVYELVGQRWADQGTAFCSGHYDETTGEAALIARSENDFKSVILSTTIRSADVYQRQQDTLIVWTEPTGVDFALSFQDPEGCAEVWSFIREVQPHIPGDDHIALESSPLLGSGSEPSVTTASIIRSGHLPTPQMGIIGEIEKAIRALARTPTLKERVCEYIQHEDYIKQLIDTMVQAEDLESLENLHALCSCMQTILTLNDHGLFEHVLEDDIFFGVVGMLEYDPEFPTYKGNYREFLSQTSRFHQPIAIRDESVNKKIHATYRLQFLKDVVLARSLDDSTFNVLSSCIIFNQIDIINHVQHDPAFLEDVIGTFTDEHTARGDPLRLDSVSVAGPATPAGEGAAIAADGVEPELTWDKDKDARRRDVLLLVQQLCSMGKNVQLPARIQLFKTLAERGIPFCVQWALSLPEKEPEARRMMAAAGEIMAALLDHALDPVRDHVVKRQQESWKKARVERGRRPPGAAGLVPPVEQSAMPETVLLVMCRAMARSRDLAVQSMIGDALKVMLELPPAEADAQAISIMKMGNRPATNVDTEHFMRYFYSDCVDALFAPLRDLPEFEDHHDPVLLLTREKTNLYLYLCDLLSNFVSQHHRLETTPAVVSMLITRIATLLSARDKHLRLAALRVFRVIVKMSNRHMMDAVLQTGVFKPVLELTLRESRRDNLLSASCQELFEFIRRENRERLIDHIMTRFEADVRHLATSRLGGPRFEALIRRWEINKEPKPRPEATRVELVQRRNPSQPREMEAEQEDYFLTDDDDHPPIVRIIDPIPPVSISLKRKRGRSFGMASGRLQRPVNIPARPSSLPSLVDYTDEDEEDGGLTSDTESSPSPHPSPSPSPGPEAQNSARSPSRAAAELPPTTRAPNRQGTGRTPNGEVGASDDVEHDLATNADPVEAPAPVSFAGKMLSGLGLPPMKRRRDDEDDELLERLATKSKRASLEGQPPRPAPDSPVPAAVEKGGKAGFPAAKGKEDGGGGGGGGKKIKLKFGTSALGVAATPNASLATDPGAKDGDTG